MKMHTILGAEILAGFRGTLGEMAQKIALYHHEKYDGQGYWKKSVCELPHYIKYVTISDIFTALICKRPYKEPWPLQDVLSYIKSQSGTTFDPSLADIFIQLICKDSRVKEILREVA